MSKDFQIIYILFLNNKIFYSYFDVNFVFHK